ncbi:helix-turn-helix transcriptional regulator [Streptomyces sp. NPDC006879]|uniref:helix-turn-helix transcriptional regulator n=1 Tax=Streptomyces sp. NPDC006879 TaxID=3364767 RepID=UPI0036CDC61C
METMETHGGERRGVLVPVLLLLLAERRGHGYELMERLRDFGCAGTEPAHVYRLLRTLEAAGSVTSHWRASDSGPARREYRLTGQGARELTHSFARLGALHMTLHLFLERCDQLGVTEPAGSEQPAPGRPPV